ncbi:hypothetical protein [Propionivibrio soli]|uniref:hypothetical protein n=1 Tax=Propionivibrio soli TaxID=2976531 RepID=UPI0021E90E1C|nr:hypothetical protein [Propionivibrio soli]
MQLEQLRLALRRRNPWEALDLGLVMLREWCGPVYRVWFATVVAFALIVFGLLWQWPGVAMFIVWWLKPLYDRILLKVFAEASFGRAPSVREVWRALPGLVRRSGLISGLTLRRFNPTRSFDLPVWQLEGQRGKAARTRRRVLGRRTGGYALWLTFVCTHLVVIFELGIVELLDIFSPGDSAPIFSWAGIFSADAEDWRVHLFNLAWIVAESIVEPFYVAAGFSLYINRRSDLEGWDIEVAFRRMSERLKEVGSTVRRAVGLLLVTAGLALPLAFPREAAAQVPAVAPADGPVTELEAAPTTPPPIPRPKAPVERPDGKVKKVAERILADPVFGREVKETSWQPKQKEQKAQEMEMPWWMRKLLRIAEIVAKGVRGLVYVAIVIAVAAILVILYRYRHLVAGRWAKPSPPPQRLFGLDVRPESLPDDIPGAARGEFDAGRFASGLSLLYRGTLVTLIHREHVEFRDGDTEDGCLLRVRGHVGAPALQYFARLLDTWKLAAYAAIAPDATTADELCGNWARHFDPRLADGRGQVA